MTQRKRRRNRNRQEIHDKYLTPGDFAAVTRQHRFKPIFDMKDFIARLEDEIAVKSVSDGGVMGFLV